MSVIFLIYEIIECAESCGFEFDEFVSSYIVSSTDKRSVFKRENLKSFVFNNPIVVSLLYQFKGLFRIALTFGLSSSATSSSELVSSEEDLLSYSVGVG